MKTEKRPRFDTLARILNAYWHAEDGGPHEAKRMCHDFAAQIRPRTAARFKQQLASAIAEEAVPAKDLKKWTSLALDSKQKVTEELRLVWSLAYPNEDPCRLSPGP